MEPPQEDDHVQLVENSDFSPEEDLHLEVPELQSLPKPNPNYGINYGILFNFM